MKSEQRCCGNCLHATRIGGSIKCNMIPEQRSMVVEEDGSVDASWLCGQHDFAEAA